MLWLWITMVVIGGLVLAVLIPALIMIKKLPRISKPLNDEEVRLCTKIVAEHKGYPYICRWAVKHKACPCLPCQKLESAKASG